MALTRNTYQRNSSWNAPYTFSGKEKDAETGYGYFGARYYDSGLSIWLSVDPMSDKYPSMSPYNYCANNPVILVDPDGREIVDPSGNICYTKQDGWLPNAPQETVILGNIMMETETGKAMFDALVDSETKVELKISNEDRNTNEGVTFGQFAYESSPENVIKDANGNTHIKRGTLTVFKGSVESFLNSTGPNKLSDEFGLGYGRNHTDLSMVIASNYASVYSYMASVAGHEAWHITNQENRNLYTASPKKYAETIPNMIKTNILWEYYEQMKK